MADYQLTQTGDEVQDILDNSQTGKYFYNQSVATWSSDATYADYPYKGVITLTGVKGTDGVEVTFSNADATSGNYSPICNTVANGVEIWAKAQDNALVIPTIHITTGADVQLQGDDAYLPISGGNITGSLSVVGSEVITKSAFGKIVQCGLTTAVSVSANSYADAQITFSQPFASAPSIMVCLRATSTNVGYATLQCIVVNNTVSTTGFTARVFNGGASGLSPYVAWYAIGDM